MTALTAERHAAILLWLAQQACSPGQSSNSLQHGPSKATTRLRSKAVSMDFLRDSLKIMDPKNYEKKNMQFLFSHFLGISGED